MNTRRRRLLVAVDGSVASLKAARLAVDLAGSLGGYVRFLAVVDERGPQSQEGRETQLRDTLEYVRRLGSEAGLEVEAVLHHTDGEPYERILEEAEESKADLLFVGRRGHRGIGRALLGSQAEHVLEFARLPVVVVPESGPPLRTER